MRILDESGKEVKKPDLNKGYLKRETIIIAYHDATPEVMEEYETVEIEPGLLEKRLVRPWEPAHEAWDEKEEIERYIAYTPEELAQMEADRKAQEEAQREAEKAAAEAAERQAALDALPERVDDIEEGIAEVGVMAAGNQVAMEDVMEALAEIGVMVAEIKEA